MKLLITSFDAFGKDKINPSYKAVSLLPKVINGIEIVKKQLPTKYKESELVMNKYINEINPDFVIAVGQAEGRSKISLEKVAINLMTASIEDNDGYLPVDEPIKVGGKTAYFSSLPIRKIFNNLKQQKIPVEISYSAGTFVCNKVFYDLMYLVNEKASKFKAGFIHVPLIPSQLENRDKDIATMELVEIVDALSSVISSLSELEC